MHLINQEAIGTDDVTICTQFSDLKSRSDVDVRAVNHQYPIIASPMWHLGTTAMARFFADKGCPYVLHRYFKTVEDQYNAYYEMNRGYNDGSSNIFVAVGKDYEWIQYLIDKGVDKFCVDMAHGNSEYCVRSIRYIKQYCPDAVIMAGNIESHDAYVRLKVAGASYFRVGIASGSICSTNINTGNGLPILTALDNIYARMTKSERKHNFLIADGGMRTAGDIAKALAFGASYAMCGKLFAATSKAEGPFYNENSEPTWEEARGAFSKGEWKTHHIEWAMGKPEFVQYAGMASKMMREKAGGTQPTAVSEEGMAGLIPYTGTTESVFEGLIMNLKAVLSYSGCEDIEEFRDNVILQRISMGGKREKKIHLDKVY